MEFISRPFGSEFQARATLPSISVHLPCSSAPTSPRPRDFPPCRVRSWHLRPSRCSWQSRGAFWGDSLGGKKGCVVGVHTCLYTRLHASRAAASCAGGHQPLLCFGICQTPAPGDLRRATGFAPGATCTPPQLCAGASPRQAEARGRGVTRCRRQVLTQGCHVG